MYCDSGTVSFATRQACGESLAAMCGMASPKATRAASGEENETAMSGFQVSINSASFVMRWALAVSLPYAVPPPCSPTIVNGIFLSCSVWTASRYFRVVTRTS